MSKKSELIDWDSFCKEKHRLKALCKQLAEALEIIKQGSLDEMRAYCLKHKTANGMAGDNTACAMVRVAKTALAAYEKEKT